MDAGTGRLALRQWTPSGGRTPRFFAPDPAGRFVYVVNEDSDAILKLEVVAGTGELVPAGEAARIGGSVCIVFRNGPRSGFGRA